MNELGGATTVLISITLGLIGATIAFSTRRRNRIPGTLYFALLCIALAVWVSANFVSDIDTGHSVWWVRASFAAISVGLFSFLMFVNRFPTPRFVALRETLTHSAVLVVMLCIIATPLFIPEVVFRSGISNVVPGMLYPIFIVYVIFMLGLALYRLSRAHRLLKGQYRSQVDYIIAGVATMAVVALITNLILPLITGNNDLYWIGSSASILFVLFVVYSIAQHRLFDIKRAAIRSIAYTLALATILSLYSMAFVAGAAHLMGLEELSMERQLLVLGMATAIGITIPPLVKFFDKATRRIFFRHLYDPQEVLSQLGVITETEVSMTPFARQSLALLEDALHPEYIHLIAVDHGDKLVHFRVGDSPIKKDLFEDFTKYASSQNDGAVADIELQEMLGRNHVGYFINLDVSQRRVGCLILGYRANGSNYSSSDIDFIDLFSDEMALALQNILRLKEIQDFNKTLQTNIEEATNELRTTNQKLRMIDASKDEFISMASHQLRTPLTSIKGYISMLLEGDIGTITTEQRKVLEEAYTSSQRMVYLIGDFLNVSRLQTGKFELERSDIHLPTLLAEEIDQLRASAKSRNIILKYESPEQFPRLPLDENKIRQVMMNFIDNAIYYAKPDGGTVTVTLAKHSRHISFKVSDDGIGVPRGEQHRLFSKFYRASNARRVRPDGTGIGLFMAKKVVVAHGGAILFESKESRGSTFGFRLPITKD